MTNWSIADSLRTYNVDRWGEGHFGINPAGHVTVLPGNTVDAEIDLCDVANAIRNAGLDWPVLVRFPRILRQRADDLCRAFDVAAEGQGYTGSYEPIYPVKVNQNRHVVTELLKAADGRVGLEAGSKPEMFAVMALSRPGGTVICNGYKDREYIRLALSAVRMGLRSVIIIEKPSELALITEQARETGVRPLLGMRIKLASIASGKWQSSGGEKSKFGLTSGQALEAIRSLREAGLLDCLQMLHVHLGSQMSNILDIRNGIGEAARFYAELSRAGAPLCAVDVGGGLGVDYEGTRTRSDCSVNYDMGEYATSIVEAFVEICRQYDLQHPDLLSESGRALTAHHALLITNVTEVDVRDKRVPAAGKHESGPAAALRQLLERLDGDASLGELFHEVQHVYEDIQHMFAHGQLGIEQRSVAEQLYYAACSRIFARLNPAIAAHRRMFEQLEDSLADKVFCNFSVFQSMPDVWAIDQVFPVVPLQRLGQQPDRRAVIHDLTCDSDGRIDYYVDRDGIESTLALHLPGPDSDYLLGMFMVGAYQETLGDIHNLFGGTAAVNVNRTAGGELQLEHLARGETVRDLLDTVEYDPDEIRQMILARARNSGLEDTEREKMLDELELLLNSYSYLRHAGS